MKKIISFSALPTHGELKPIEFKTIPNGIEFDTVIFSTANNRNKAYFEVYKLLRWQNKLASVMHNFNHDLELTNGKYLGNQSQFTRMWSEFVDGELEIWATFQSTDPVVVTQAANITAPSIEIMVDTKNVIANEHGEYYIDYDFVGCAWLLGVLQGSGNARLTSAIREFDLNLNPLNNNMDETQIKELLEAQKAELIQAFSTQIDSIKQDFTQILSEIEEKKPEVPPAEEPPAEEPKAEDPKTETEEDTETENNLTKIENNLIQAEKISEKMKQFKSEDLVTDQNGAVKGAETNVVSNFLSKFSK